MENDKVSSEAKVISKSNANFLCGVAEGFYGKPWTAEQRKELFKMLGKWGMNSYLYAPKDDCKHRAYWRELYSVEEGEHLSNLICSAKEQNITFYYAISPGLDIIYSSSKDVSCMKRKFDQVAQLGCQAFALLFDDILPEMSEADKEVFQSFAHAHVSITNDIFEHLHEPPFLFCPTQYCGSIAIPNVANSEYLKTLGSKLAPGVDIIWTGPRIISKTIRLESVQELTEVLHRPPVIWDNLHANDYDQKRLFLGPYCGRSPQLIPHLRGVLTNPNCKFEANFIGIHTLAQWGSCSIDVPQFPNCTINADIKLEAEGENGASEGEPLSLPPDVYHPRRALRLAINEWMLEFYRTKSYPEVIKTQSKNGIDGNSSVTVVSDVSSAETAAFKKEAECSLPCQIYSSVPIMNSLIADDKIIISNQPSSVVQVDENQSLIHCKDVEPMDCHPTSLLSIIEENKKNHAEDDSKMLIESTQENGKEKLLSKISLENHEIESSTSSPNKTPMDMESDSGEREDIEKSNLDIVNSASMSVDVNCVSSPEKQLVVEDITLLTELFCLPYEYGPQGLLLLHEFNWLKVNAYVIQENKNREECTPEVEEWWRRAESLRNLSKSLTLLLQHLLQIPNKCLLYDLYPYVWDLQGVLSVACCYITWLGESSKLSKENVAFVTGHRTWSSKSWKDSFTSGDQEPWMFIGGLTGELQRLLPVDSSNDLFVYKTPEIPLSQLYAVRSYKSSDLSSVYDICRVTYTKEQLDDNSYNLIPDSLIGGFLSFSPDSCFVIYEATEEKVVGFCVTAVNVKLFYDHLRIIWQPELSRKYVNLKDTEMALSNLEIKLHNDFSDPPPCVTRQYTSELQIAIMSNVLDHSMTKRLLACSLAALRTQGCFGTFVKIPANENKQLEFYTKLGFTEISPGVACDKIYLGRTF